jgi:hypothetical protein
VKFQKSSNEGYQWFWKSDSGYEPFDSSLSAQIEMNFTKGMKQMPIDSERFLDFDSMCQRRKDFPNKARPIKRERATTTSKNTSRYEYEWPPRYDPSRYGLISSSSLEHKNPSPNSKERNKSTNSGYPLEAKWFWESDKGRVEYPLSLASDLEKVFQSLHKNEKVRIDQERYVDLQRMAQCRYDDPSRVNSS